jgi:hypothetical protein
MILICGTEHIFSTQELQVCPLNLCNKNSINRWHARLLTVMEAKKPRSYYLHTWRLVRDGSLGSKWHLLAAACK